jgi:hypothetical protein
MCRTGRQTFAFHIPMRSHPATGADWQRYLQVVHKDRGFLFLLQQVSTIAPGGIGIRGRKGRLK